LTPTFVQGEDGPEALSAANSLAAVFQSQGRLDDAEALYRHTVSIRREADGDEDPETLSAITNLATLLHAKVRLCARGGAGLSQPCSMRYLELPFLSRA
jgi:hypothetical protein